VSYIVGLTGGIGSGKSAAAAAFGELGAAIVDVDAIAHELSAPQGAAIAAIRAAFGDALIDGRGALDRAAMRRLVFADPDARQRLEAILHPLIRAESARRCAAAVAPYVVLVVPLLIESGNYRERCDRIAVVDCSEAMQIARVVARNGISSDEVRRIMAVQASRSERLAAADDVIDNEDGFAELQRQVAELHPFYLNEARNKAARG
jgi:dephospho-CoA kinase